MKCLLLEIKTTVVVMDCGVATLLFMCTMGATAGSSATPSGTIKYTWFQARLQPGSEMNPHKVPNAGGLSVW